MKKPAAKPTLEQLTSKWEQLTPAQRWQLFLAAMALLVKNALGLRKKG